MGESIAVVSMPAVTLLFAGILGLMAFAVALPAGRLRGKTGISVGDGGNQDLLVAMRRHGNFVEVVPIALVLMGLLEMNGVSTTAIFVFGTVLVVCRIAHAVGLKADDIQNIARGVGAGGSALLTVVMSVWAVVLFF